jgi:hypothetical protein
MKEMISFVDHMGEILEWQGHVYVYSHKSDISGEMLYYYTLKSETCVT